MSRDGRVLCVFATISVAFGETRFPITCLGAKSAQALFSYSAPDPSPCTVRESIDPGFRLGRRYAIENGSWLGG